MYLPHEFLIRNATLFPNRLALVASGLEFTYADTERRACDVANALRAKGIDVGDRVTFLLGNHVPFMVLLQALFKLGAVAVPLNKRLLANDIAYMVEHVEAKALFFDTDMNDIVGAAIEQIGFKGLTVACGEGVPDYALNWNDFKYSEEGYGDYLLDGYVSPQSESLILFTSGTTGKPKAVVRTADQVAMLSTIQLVEGHSHRNEVPIIYTQAPVFHMGGICTMLKSFAMAGTLVLESHFNAETIFKLIEKYQVNQMYMIPPALFTRLYESEALKGRTFESVSEAHCAGGRTRVCDLESVEAMFPNARIRLSFGSSESGMTCTSYFTPAQLKEREALRNTVGTPNAFVITKLVDSDGNEVAPGTPSELLIKSPGMFDSYLKLPDKTTDSFDADGFFRTGDMLYRDEAGYYYFIDRIKDMIKTGGENVFAVEVERTVGAFPEVADVAVIGIPDEEFGDAIGAAIVLKDGVSELDTNALIEFCKQRIASFKKPRYLLIVDEIPRNPLGKVQKEELRARSGEFTPIV